MKQENQQSDVTLKSLREAIGLTQPQLSNRLGCGIRIISHWENGNKLPRLDNAIALARELGVSLKTLSEALDLDVTGVPDDLDCEKKSVARTTVPVNKKS